MARLRFQGSVVNVPEDKVEGLLRRGFTRETEPAKATKRTTKSAKKATK